MNNRSPLLVRTLLAITVLALAMPIRAQEADPLIEGLKHLSPKERSQMAAKETTEAESDSAYQAVMQLAEAAFREARYEDALSAYEQARKMRPYNVYPKVKIQDLQVLLKRREQKSSQAAPTEATGTLPEVTPSPSRPGTSGSTSPPTDPGPVDVGHPAERPSARPDPIRPAAKPSKGEDPVSSKPLIPGERTYMEGGAVVTERVVEEEEKLVVYKRVVQRSGQVFHFKDRRPIPAQVWDELFR